ncbi:MAG: DUF389 domain-containing protein [Candidatus Peribacteria bacterium]|nr:MAG: DUF389 domain-containing protein [Candidatus Peribacteria bacterium]
MDREVSLEIAQEQSSIEGILTKEEKKQLKKEAIKELQKTENQDGEKPLIKVELTKEEKVSIFFDRIDFLSLDDDGKERVAVDVKTQAVGDNLYWIEVVLSAVIATLGLLQNSVAVIIGAMLITPLLRPINGVAFSIANGGTKFYFKALKVLFYSILVSMFIGYVVSLIAGVASENQEILSRTSPNIMDFFIAIFSAVIAVLSLRYSRL